MQFFVLFVCFVVASLSLSNAENLVRLHAQTPARVSHAILDCQAGILVCTIAVHRLEEEMIEIERLEFLRRRPGLGVHELELIALPLNQLRPGLRADADPVYGIGGGPRPIGLDGHVEALLMKALYERLVQLEKRLASRTDDEPCVTAFTSPGPGNRLSEVFG
jgi:hypothetical protein